MDSSAVPSADSPECEALRNATIRLRPEPIDRPEGVKASLALFIILETLLVLNLVIFLFFKYLHHARNELYRLQHRRTVLVFTSHIGAALVPLVGSWFQANELRVGLPCWLYLIGFFMNVPLIVFPIASQLLHLYRKRQWTQAVVLSTQNTRMTAGDDQEVGSVAESETSRFSAHGIYVRVMTLLNVVFCQGTHKTHALIEDQRKNSTAPIKSGTAPLMLRNQKERTRILRFLKSESGANLTLALFCLPYIITTAAYIGTSMFVRMGCYGCVPDPAQEAVLIVESVIALAIIVFAFRINRKSEDPYHYVEEARICAWAGGVWAVLFLILNAALRARQKTSNFQLVMLVEISIYIICFVQTVLQVILALRERKSAKIGDHQSSRKECEYSIEQFEEMFLSKSGTFHALFAKHLESEFSYESVAFLDNVSAWEKSFYDLGPKTSRSRAKRIATMFIGERAELPINLPAHIVQHVWSALGNNERDLHQEFFVAARSEIISMLYRDSFRRFIRSEAFKQQLASTPNSMQHTSVTSKRTDATAVAPGLL